MYHIRSFGNEISWLEKITPQKKKKKDTLPDENMTKGTNNKRRGGRTG